MQVKGITYILYVVPFVVYISTQYILGGNVMNKALRVIISLGAAITLVGCATAIEPEHTQYVAQGRYYTAGTVVTTDGNVWNYATNTISDKIPFDGMPINVGFDDNGTPDNIYDDIILGVTWDVETNIYDSLEKALSERFDLERNGNIIHINNTK